MLMLVTTTSSSGPKNQKTVATGSYRSTAFLGNLYCPFKRKVDWLTHCVGEVSQGFDVKQLIVDDL